MAIRIPYILFVFILGLSGEMLQAQDEPVPVKRSEDKVILEGKIYYIHIVKEKQTLYSISRAYNVTEKLIAVENPDVFAGLRTGMVLKIPAEPVVDEQEFTLESDEYIFHIIKEEETLYSLSRQYNITISDIRDHNPEVKYSELQINQVIKIPKIEREIKEKEFSDNSFVYHLVEEGETLYGLSRLYNVSEEEIKELNQKLLWGELKYDEYIKIPVSREPEVAGDSAFFEPFHDTIDIDSLDLFRERWTALLRECSFMDSIAQDSITGTIDIGLFLPLLLHWQEQAEEEPVDSLMFEEEEGEEVEEEEPPVLNPMTVAFLEFYEGILLAMDSLRQTGISINLWVHDTDKNPDILNHLLDSIDISGLDLIIGPVDPRNVEILSDYSWRHRIPMISPFYASDELIYSNPFLVQVPPSSTVQLQQYAAYLSDYFDRTLVYIHNGDSLDMARTQFFKNEILANLSEKVPLDEVLFKEVIINDSLPSVYYHTLTRDTENIIIIPSIEEGEVSNILTGLYFLLDEYDIKVFGMPNWQRFRSIDLEYFHQLQLHYFTSFFVDYESQAVKNYLQKHKRAYKAEPYRISSRGYNISMLAYDIMLYFCPLVTEHGRNLIFELNRTASHPMMGDYDFIQLHNYSGNVNKYTCIIRYNRDLSIQHILPEPVAPDEYVRAEKQIE